MSALFDVEHEGARAPRDAPRRRHVMVLLTGDGNANDGLSSFTRCVQHALRRGWLVEVWSWRESFGSRYSELLLMHLDAVRLHALDNHRDAITRIIDESKGCNQRYKLNSYR
jgi:hypothetical protein